MASQSMLKKKSETKKDNFSIHETFNLSHGTWAGFPQKKATPKEKRSGEGIISHWLLTSKGCCKLMDTKKETRESFHGFLDGDRWILEAIRAKERFGLYL